MTNFTISFLNILLILCIIILNINFSLFLSSQILLLIILRYIQTTSLFSNLKIILLLKILLSTLIIPGQIILPLSRRRIIFSQLRKLLRMIAITSRITNTLYFGLWNNINSSNFLLIPVININILLSKLDLSFYLSMNSILFIHFRIKTRSPLQKILSDQNIVRISMCIWILFNTQSLTSDILRPRSRRGLQFRSTSF